MNKNLYFQKFRKGQFVFDKAKGELFKVICLSEYTSLPFLILQRENGTFVRSRIETLEPTKAKFRKDKTIRNGCLVKIVNPYIDNFGKKLSVKAINGPFITVVTQYGLETIHIGCVQIYK